MANQARQPNINKVFEVLNSESVAEWQDEWSIDPTLLDQLSTLDIAGVNRQFSTGGLRAATRFLIKQISTLFPDVPEGALEGLRKMCEYQTTKEKGKKFVEEIKSQLPSIEEVEWTRPNLDPIVVTDAEFIAGMGPDGDYALKVLNAFRASLDPEQLQYYLGRRSRGVRSSQLGDLIRAAQWDRMGALLPADCKAIAKMHGLLPEYQMGGNTLWFPGTVI